MWKEASTPVKTTPTPTPVTEPTNTQAQSNDRSACIGKSVVIKGELIGSEDLMIDGRIEGRVELKGHNLLIGPNAQVQAHLTARTITVMGTVTGSLVATEKVDIRMTGKVEGDIDAPKVIMAEGAQLRGKIDTLTQSEKQKPQQPQQRQPLAIAV